MEQIGRYLIQGELGRGAMGIVYRATDPAIGRTIAIKTVSLAQVTDPVQRQELQMRLLREVQSAGALSHPGIVTIYDTGEQGDLAYFAMEFVDGETLDRALAKPPGVPKDRVLEILRQTASALDYAHRHGVIHRDIKPANIMIDREGAVKITDFGVAKISTAAQVTQAGSILGTPNYMSPEQIKGDEVTGQADQFSLAVVAYEMLTGERPFASDQVHTTLYRIVAEPPAPVSQINAHLSEEVDEVFKRALAKHHATRFDSCSKFQDALERALSRTPLWAPIAHGELENLPTFAGAATPPQTAAPGMGQRTGAPVSASPSGSVRSNPEAAAPLLADIDDEEPRKQRWPLYVAGALLIAVGSALAVFLLSPGSETVPPADAQRVITTPAEPGPPPAAQPTSEGTSDAGAVATPASGASEPSRQPPDPQPPQPPSSAASRPGRTTPAPPPSARHLVRILSDPPGARLVLDGATGEPCTAPCTRELAEGSHTAAAVLAGYQTGFEQFEVTGPGTEVTVNLKQITGLLQVESEPTGASVSIDGKPHVRPTPTTLELPPGTYTLTVQKRGYQAVQTQIEIKANGFAKQTFRLAME